MEAHTSFCAVFRCTWIDETAATTATHVGIEHKVYSLSSRVRPKRFEFLLVLQVPDVKQSKMGGCTPRAPLAPKKEKRIFAEGSFSAAVPCASNYERLGTMECRWNAIIDKHVRPPLGTGLTSLKVN